MTSWSRDRESLTSPPWTSSKAISSWGEPTWIWSLGHSSQPGISGSKRSTPRENSGLKIHQGVLSGSWCRSVHNTGQMLLSITRSQERISVSLNCRSPIHEVGSNFLTKLCDFKINWLINVFTSTTSTEVLCYCSKHINKKIKHVDSSCEVMVTGYATDLVF